MTSFNLRRNSLPVSITTFDDTVLNCTLYEISGLQRDEYFSFLTGLMLPGGHL